MLIKSIKVLTSEWLAILLVTSLLSTSYILNSKALTQEDEESGYLKYASQLVKDSNNSSTSRNATTIPIPQAAKGPPIPSKGYLVQQIRGICIGLPMAAIILCF